MSKSIEKKTIPTNSDTSPNTNERAKDIVFSIKDSITNRDNVSNRHLEELARIVKNLSDEEWQVVGRAMPTEVLATEVSYRLIDLTSNTTAFLNMAERIKEVTTWKV